jgi:flagellar basal-body rod modification protein FlgD
MSTPIGTVGSSPSLAGWSTSSSAAPATTTPSSSSSSSTGSGSSGSVASTVQSLAGTDTFLQLLVAQLQNQDPTSPMDDSTFITELAQFNSVEQMINLTTEVTTEVTQEQTSEGVALLGKTITYADQSATSGSTTPSQGVVTGVSMESDGVYLQMGATSVPLEEVTAVSG